MKKLPILATTRTVYELTFQHAGYAVRISWHWLLLIVVASLPLLSFMTTNDENAHSFFAVVLILLWAILLMAGWSSIAVLWHRRLLRHGEPKGLPIRLDACTAQYLRRFINIGVVLFVLAILARILARIIGGDQITLASLANQGIFDLVGLAKKDFVWFLISLLVSAAIVIVSLRLSVALPALALGDAKTTLDRAWNATAGNALRLLVIAILISLPVLIIDGLILRVEDVLLLETGSYAKALFYILLWTVVRPVPLLLGVSLLSVAYAELIEKRSIGSMAHANV
ncbi:MAG: hypothetical protein ACRBM6_32900 [Geminicoccales bacterium]